jgi:hypothetical protein
MLFASLFLYAAEKHCSVVERAAEAWPERVKRWRRQPQTCPWPGMRTLAALGTLGEPVAEFINAGAFITRGRSRAAGRFLTSKADVWVSCDDDVEADDQVVRRLVERCRSTVGLVVAPTVLRGRSTSDVVQHAAGEREGDLLPISRTAFGLVALHREAVLSVLPGAPIARDEEQGYEYPALFLERVEAGQWLHEDYAFCDLARSRGVPMHALLGALTRHAHVPFTLQAPQVA